MAHSVFIFALLLHLLRLCGGTGAASVKHDAMVVSMSLSDNGLVRREETKESKERVKWHRQWRVKCDTTSGEIHIQMDPESSPQGVRRFLDLVRDGFFQDQAIFRAVRGFVAQFGISDKSELNEKWSPTIQDDGNLGQKALNFTKGTLSFAGTGPHTRNMQVFVTLSDLTGKMGKNPWETPIGRVAEEDLPILDRIFTGYSDGVDQDDFLHHGNSFLKEFYPRLDYIKTCSLLDDPISSM